MRRVCKKCNTEKNISEFQKRKDTKTVCYTYKCKACKNGEHDWEVQKNKHLQRLYGIDIEHYNTMFTSQGGRCAICHTHQSEHERRFSVDHCHETGRIRQLLCGNCNVGLGNFKDNQELLLAAITYLIKHKV